MTQKKAYLILENEAVFEGTYLGYADQAVGRLVFNTDMYGYEKTLKNPVHYGDICMFTFPLIGNTGISDNDYHNSRCYPVAIVLNEYCDTPSNFMSAHTLNEYLVKNRVCGIFGIDTRHVMKIIREQGAMNAMISLDPPQKDTFRLIKEYTTQNAIASCSTKKIIEYRIPNAKYNVSVIDYGNKDMIIKELNDRMCNITVVPHDAMDEEIFDSYTDGIVLSDGPFDEKAHGILVRAIKGIIGRKPIFATGLSHLLLAESLGYEIKKRRTLQGGSNYPVIDVLSGKVFITSNDHIYTVAEKDRDDKNIYMVNTADENIAAMDYSDISAFSSQFVPTTKTCPGNTGILYDRFIKMMEEFKNA